MFPILFEIGSFKLHSFGLMAALAFLSGLFIMTAMAKRGRAGGLTSDGVSQLMVFLMVGGALGARIAYVAEHWSSEFANAPLLEPLRFDKGGLMFYGGLIGAILAIAVLSHVKKASLVGMLDLCAAVLPLGHALGRIGCFLNGCCYGTVCGNSPIGIHYPVGSTVWCEQVENGLIGRGSAESLAVWPSQLIEAALNIALFAVLQRMTFRSAPKGLVSAIYLIAYGAIRFLTETLRGDPRMAVGPLSIGQFISCCCIAAGVAVAIAAVQFAHRRQTR